MRFASAIFAATATLAALIPNARAYAQEPAPHAAESSSATYLGFDSNDYPGDAEIPLLAKTFKFSGYWLNAPPGEEPGEAVNGWKGKRKILLKTGLGFLVLFNGRWERELENENHAVSLGKSDAKAAVEAATAEGFARGTVIFLDQEEGGSMSDDQMAYLLAWFDAVKSSGFYAGIYCSGMPADEGGGHFTITANFIREHDEKRHVEFFVYNDACPPAPGCVYGQHAPAPSGSGVAFASIWQYAQSPQRMQFTKKCRETYGLEGNCYPPAAGGAGQILLDLDSATSPDPSHGRQ